MDDWSGDGDALIPHVKKKMGVKAQGMKPHMRMDRRTRGGETSGHWIHGEISKHPAKTLKGMNS